MNQNLNPIYQIRYIPAHLVTLFITRPEGTVEINTKESIRHVTFSTGSQTFQSTSKQTKSGELYTSSVSTSLRKTINESGQMIFFIRFCDGTVLVMGSPEIPVLINSTHTDQVRSLQLDYESPNPLLKLTNSESLFNGL
jgi:hypothetical protein